MVVAGVGGTGVITIGQLLGWRRTRGQGRGHAGCGGPAGTERRGHSGSYALIGAHQDDICTTRVSLAAADSHHRLRPGGHRRQGNRAACMGRGRTRVALNSDAPPTAASVHNLDW